MRKIKLRHKRKFRLLLDSAFAKPAFFPKIKKKANLAHAVHDCGLSPQAEDEEIYQKAVMENRFIVTINFKDFKKMIKKNCPGIIGIESQLTNKKIDAVVTKFITENNPDDFIGKAIKL